MFGLHFAEQQLACARPIIDLCTERWPLRTAPAGSRVEVSPKLGSCLLSGPWGPLHRILAPSTNTSPASSV